MKYILFIVFSLSHLLSAQTNKFAYTLNDGSDISSFLSQYVQLESYSGHEIQAGTFIRETCKSHGLHIKQMGETNGNFNFAASLFPLELKKPNIILLNHIDVVHIGHPSDWIFPAFSGKIVDGEVWGRGAFDNKGLAAMQLFSLLQFATNHKTQELPYNVTLLSVSCEETNCEGGAAFVANRYLDELNPIVVLGEGAPGLNNILRSDPEKYLYGISVAHKRALWLKLELSVSVSGHGSVTPLRYANKEMIEALHGLTKKVQPFILNDLNAQILKDLGDLERGVLKMVMKHPRTFKKLIKSRIKNFPEMYSLFSNTITLTNIENHNTVFNKIPEKAIAFLDCRLLPGQDETEFLNYIQKQLKNNRISITIANSMEEMQVSSMNTVFYKTLEKVLLDNHPDGAVMPMIIPNYNDCGKFRSKGINSYASNLFEIERKIMHTIHNTNERLPVKALNEGAQIYFDFINEIQTIEQGEEL